jgi:glycosyltransferase involved in cell wall biosynthesis
MGIPTITIVTPSLNQGDFIEQAIRSVLDQKLPNLEYIVIDGGSTDGTLDVLRRYESDLAHCVSEPDRGQADAINKGFSLGTGELCGYLNSDDLYEPGCLARVIDDFRTGPDRAWHAYPVRDFSADGPRDLHAAPRWSRRLGQLPAEEAERLSNDLLHWVLGRVGLHQPGVFWRRDQWARVGGFDTRYHYAFDRRFFMSLVSAGYPLVCHDGHPVARFRLHDRSKTGTHLRGVDNAFVRERIRIADEFERYLSMNDRKLARRTRVEDAVSAGWRMFREGASRRSCCAWLGRVALSRPEALGSRYFWGSALRFLAQTRRKRP